MSSSVQLRNRLTGGRDNRWQAMIRAHREKLTGPAARLELGGETGASPGLRLCFNGAAACAPFDNPDDKNPAAQKDEFPRALALAESGAGAALGETREYES